MRPKTEKYLGDIACRNVTAVNDVPVYAQSNTITPTLKKVGYGIKDSDGTVNVYEQVLLIKSMAVNVHGGIAIQALILETGGKVGNDIS